jgi:3-hydroxybutyryl-CoA dehydratase
MHARKQLFFEDFRPGQRYSGGERTVRQADVQSFAAITGDAHPIHYDAEYAKRTRFGRPIVHGLHLMSLTALGAAPLAEQLRESMIAMVEQGARYLKPVFVDDTVCCEFEVAQVERKAGHRGRVKFSVKLLNRQDETILEGHHAYVLRCRTAEPGNGDP